MKIDGRFVEKWAGEYEAVMQAVESELFDDVGPLVASRGWYEPAEFERVAAWKTARSRPLIASNDEGDVRDVTRLALGAPERLQHRVLTLLTGVRVPTATALLAVVLPARHTIIDVRSTNALRRLGEWDGSGGYLRYLAVCRRLALEAGASLRRLDRALWQWDKYG